MIENWVKRYEGDPEFEFDRLALDVGERIVERMEKLGMSRTDLAAAVGVSKARISQILSGHDNLTLKSLVAVAAGLESRIELRLRNARDSTGSLRAHRRPVDLDSSVLAEDNIATLLPGNSRVSEGSVEPSP